MPNILGSATYKLETDATQFNRGIDQAQTKARGSVTEITKGFASVGPAAALGFAAAGAAVGKFAIDGIGAAVNFQSKMNEVFTLLPGISQQAMGQMTDQLKTFDQQAGVTSSQSIPALYQALSAGIPPGNVFDFLQQANEAAVGGVSDLTTSVDALSSVVNAYGADVLSAQQASDQMFTAIRLGKTTFGELASSLSNVTPVAASIGVSFGDITSALAAMTAQGVPTAQATTQLRQALIELSKDGSAAAATFQSIAGVSFQDFLAQGHNLNEALDLMAQYAQTSGKNVSDLFSSVEAGNAVLALTGRGSKTFADDIKAAGDSAGATGKAYDQMSDSAQRNIDKMNVAWENFKLAIFDDALPALTAFAQFGADNLPKVTAKMDELTASVKKVGDALDHADRLLGGSGIGAALRSATGLPGLPGQTAPATYLPKSDPNSPLNQYFNDLPPVKAFNDVFDAIQKRYDEFHDKSKTTFDGAKEDIIGMRDVMVDTATLTDDSLVKINEGLARVGTGFDDMGGEVRPAVDAITEGLDRVGSGFGNINKVLNDTTVAGVGAIEMLDRVGSGLADVSREALSWSGIQSLIDQNISNANGAYDTWTQKLDGAQNALDILNQKQKDGKTLSADEIQQKKELQQAVERYKGGIEDQTGAVVDAQVQALRFRRDEG